MKIRYFSYYLMDDNFNYYRFDLRSFFDKYCSCGVPEFKRCFQHIDEALYLFARGAGEYVLIKTKSDDLIKKIDTNALSFDDIKKLLAVDDKLGYAAYLFVDEEYFAIGSTLFAPKIRELQRFVSLILQAIGIDNNYFQVEVLSSVHSKQDVVREDFIGASTIKVGRTSGIFEDIANTFLGRGVEQTDIGSFEVTIKPKRGRSIKREVLLIAGHLATDDYEKFVIRAKDEKTSQLTEIYLDGSGAITDVVLEKEETKILSKIGEVALENKLMIQKAREAYSDDEIQASRDNPNHNSIFNEPWDNRINAFLSGL